MADTKTISSPVLMTNNNTMTVAAKTYKAVVKDNQLVADNRDINPGVIIGNYQHRV